MSDTSTDNLTWSKLQHDDATDTFIGLCHRSFTVHLHLACVLKIFSSCAHFASTNRHRVCMTCSGSSFHLASVPFVPVVTVSALSSSFSRRISFSSFPMANMKSMSVTLSASVTSEANHAARVAKADWAGPPGCRTAPTAVDREILLGRTRKLFAPGMMRRPYRSPRLASTRLMSGVHHKYST